MRVGHDNAVVKLGAGTRMWTAARGGVRGPSVLGRERTGVLGRRNGLNKTSLLMGKHNIPFPA